MQTMEERVTTGAVLIIVMGVAAVCLGLTSRRYVQKHGFMSRSGPSNGFGPTLRWVSPDETDLIRKAMIGFAMPAVVGIIFIGFGLWTLISPATLLHLLGTKYP